MEYITSRSYPLPKSRIEWGDMLFYNIWLRKHWPYLHVKKNDIIFWYNSRQNKVVLKSQIKEIIKTQFDNKIELEKILIEKFGNLDTNHRYWNQTPDSGYCIAFKVKYIEPLNLIKPDGIKFPQLGWNEVNDSDKSGWFELLSEKHKKNPSWTRDELILALNVYFKINPAKVNSKHKEIRNLSKILINLSIHPPSSRKNNFRNPDGVYMKLCNFLRLDPSYKGKGLSAGSIREEEVWNSFKNNRSKLKKIAKIIMNSNTLTSDENLKKNLISTDPEEEFPEGGTITKLHKTHERNQTVVRNKKKYELEKYGKLVCEVCQFDFSAFYGERGEGYIECHHNIPFDDLNSERKTKLSDLSLVCSNCHKMIHRPKSTLSIEALKEILQNLNSQM